MDNLYNFNGLIFWSEEDINRRDFFVRYISDSLLISLKEQNFSFNMVRVEAPILTPNNLINKNYTDEDVFRTEELTLRPETTIGSYYYAKKILSGYNDIKYKPPLIVWQHGKSFRKEQDQVTKNMRLKEFYQLEFQIIYSLNTQNDYSIKVKEDIKNALSKLIGDCVLEPSDRLPDYSTETTDIICKDNNMEVCSISKRNDFEGYNVLEVAIGTDRLLYNFNKK